MELDTTGAMNEVKGRRLLDQAKQEFPILGTIPMGFKMNPRPNSGFLEFWPGDETGTPERPRPPEFPPGQIGVEVYDPKTRPIDVMGDVASHHLIYSDPQMKQYYQQFQQSITPDQRGRLQAQYEWAQKNEGESRPYAAWEEHSGMPGYFRGYPFQQWDMPNEIYTQEQLNMLDEMMAYLRAPRKP